MLVLNENETAAALGWAPLIAALKEMFAGDCQMPVRHHHTMSVPGRAEATLLLMPAWLPGRYCGVKLVSVFPDNHLSGLPAVQGGYLLTSGGTGTLLALIDGSVLTARRTAAASALAAHYLAREDASHLLVVGTGRLSLHLIEAHATVRPLNRISVWGRNLAKAEETAAAARELGFAAEAVDALEPCVRLADIISCATLANDPLICGDWLKPGAHLDLVGGFRPSMREADDAAIRRSRVYVDTRGGAMTEAGDIVQPLANGTLTPEGVCGELSELVRGTVHGRGRPEEITLFKSVGAALEDLAGAVLAYETVKGLRQKTG